ncbi:DNA-binding transcriptional regulator, FrmR family [Sporobacter termitidis DSM 10068]|uniref:DNA-binding transcriptional regulator, FrmR family n=1 Tax=Sporobacter termitidis DSM 10068 TaxID=1123282 RepID=A0A1M5Z215_9FIRM|nr:metal-sensing transcriptional repressor [Sporobacter termitidis]SHI18297.1 DNA-binding transcriptional regulator, FrmR family [Sporobacter termitidis DSM 10068]
MYTENFFNEKELRRHHDHEHDTAVAHSHDDALAGAHVHHTHAHTHTNSKAVLNRLSKLIGHLNAVKHMVEDGRDCSEVLIQLAAVRSAINATCKIILKDHIDHCIVDAVETGDTETIEELNRAIEILMK